jgi:superfamily II DNA/RNA helicase
MLQYQPSQSVVLLLVCAILTIRMNCFLQKIRQPVFVLRHFRCFSASTSSLNMNPVFQMKKPFTEIITNSDMIEILKEKGFETATDIQFKAYNAIFNESKDIVIGAETGSGKTLSYILPLLAKYGTDSTKPCRGIILAPTSALCDQIYNMTSFLFSSLSTRSNSSFAITRSTENIPQWTKESEGTEKIGFEVIVCTPKPLVSMIKMTCNDVYSIDHPLRHLDVLVLDEADMLLDGSYLKDTEQLLEYVRLVRRALIRENLLMNHNSRTQTILAAATIPSYGVKSIRNLIREKFPQVI